MPIRACEWCQAPIYPATTGRPIRFCGPTCRQAARRAALLTAFPPRLATPGPHRRLAPPATTPLTSTDTPPATTSTNPDA
jgi:hypothetical protein